MKTFLKALGWILGIPAALIFVFALLGFLAINFNFWPPTCSVLPIPQAKRVCEFSKLDHAPKGKPATITFWVSVPANTPPQDSVLLAINGQTPITMDRMGATSFQKTISGKTGDMLSYSYLRGTSSSHSDQKSVSVRSLEKSVYDYVSSWSNLLSAPLLDTNMIGFVDMKDTWTINYNMNLFEDTRKNIDLSMDRAVALGTKEFGVYSFIDMAGGKDNFTVQETASPYYHWRDAAITAEEMKTLEKKAKTHGLSVTLHYNIGADYNRYYNVNPLGAFTPGGQAGSGIGGNAAEQKAAKDFGRDEPKTRAWLDRYFTELDTILVKWAASAEKAGIDALDITPQYRPPSVAPEYGYADERYAQIIKDVRAVYHGKVYGSNFATYGGMGKGTLPKFINDLDGLAIYVAPIQVGRGASVATMRAAHTAFLNGVERDFAAYTKPLSLVMAESSYAGTTSGKPGMEWGDYKEALAAGYEQDWQEQADSYEGFFEALAGRTRFAGVGTSFYWWDDFMAPDYMGTLNNMEATIRNKPAEAVWKKWVVPLRTS
ncbi:MAG: hypothetical protein PHV99_03510 [Candidatus Pacebacteria bacterium]|nr:hypothetical protein [Candidatus Paceibacterota bacterium]